MPKLGSGAGLGKALRFLGGWMVAAEQAESRSRQAIKAATTQNSAQVLWAPEGWDGTAHGLT